MSRGRGETRDIKWGNMEGRSDGVGKEARREVRRGGGQEGAQHSFFLPFVQGISLCSGLFLSSFFFSLLNTIAP